METYFKLHNVSALDSYLFGTINIGPGVTHAVTVKNVEEETGKFANELDYITFKDAIGASFMVVEYKGQGLAPQDGVNWIGLYNLKPQEAIESSTFTFDADKLDTLEGIDYLTKTEGDIAYAPIVHTHVEADITDLDKYTQAETDLLLADKANDIDLTNHVIDTDIHYTQSAIDITASQVSDFDTEVSNNVDVAANTADRHDHLNKPVIDAFGEVLQEGVYVPTYNGNVVDTTIAQRDVYDGLDSTDNTVSLAASQGKVLNDTINGLSGVYLPLHGKADDSALLNGAVESINNINSTIVKRTTSGYIYANYLNAVGTFANSAYTAQPMAYFTGNNGIDNFGRSFSASAARTLLNVEDGANNYVLPSDVVVDADLANYLPLTGGTMTGTDALSVPNIDDMHISGFGLLGNRGAMYITNGSATGEIKWGIGGGHNAATKMTLNAAGDLGIVGDVTAVDGNLSGNLTIDKGATAGPLLTMTSSGVETRLGSVNSAWFHMDTDASQGFYMYDHLSVASLESRAGLTATTGTFTDTLNTNKVWMGNGAIDAGSSAILQVNGFQRTGPVFLYEDSSNVPVDGTALILSNEAGSLAWDGNLLWDAGNFTPSDYLPIASPSVGITVDDTRNDVMTPNFFPEKQVTAWFSDDMPGSTNVWDSAIVVKGWSDTYNVWELSSNSNVAGGDERLYIRNGLSTSFGARRQIAETLDLDNYLPLAGGTLDNGTSTTLTILSSDAGVSKLELYGDSQGTGHIFVGQTADYGGGIEYNGDGTPDITGAGSDFVTLFRKSAGTYAWTARNNQANNNWEFRGNVTAPTFIGALTGNATTATWADTVDVNSGRTDTAWYDVVWHSSDTLYSAQSALAVEIQSSTGSLRLAGRLTAGDMISNGRVNYFGGNTEFYSYSEQVYPGGVNTIVHTDAMLYNTGQVNTSINHWRGPSTIGGKITFNTNNDTEILELGANGVATFAGNIYNTGAIQTNRSDVIMYGPHIQASTSETASIFGVQSSGTLGAHIRVGGTVLKYNDGTSDYDIVTTAEDTGWVALGGVSNIDYRRVGGVVYCRGYLTNGGLAGAGFPTGFRPGSNLTFGVASEKTDVSGNTIPANATVSTAGVVAGRSHIGFKIHWDNVSWIADN